jgi:hypothetical protein
MAAEERGGLGTRSRARRDRRVRYPPDQQYLRVLRYRIHELSHDEAAIANWYNHWITAGFEALEPLLAVEAKIA